MNRRLTARQRDAMRENWMRDGADGETVHALLDEVEAALRDNEVLATALTLIRREVAAAKRLGYEHARVSLACIDLFASAAFKDCGLPGGAEDEPL